MGSDVKFSKYIETVGFNQYPDYYLNFNQLPVGQEFIIPSYQTKSEIFRTKTGESYSLSRKNIFYNHNIFVKTKKGFSYSQSVLSKRGLILSSFQQISKSPTLTKFNSKDISEDLLLFPIKYQYNMNVSDIESIKVGDMVVVNSFWGNLNRDFPEYEIENSDKFKPHFICGEVVEVLKTKLWGTYSFKVQTSKTENKFFDVKISLADIFNFGSPNYNSIFRLNKIIRSGQIKVKQYSNSQIYNMYNTELI